MHLPNCLLPASDEQTHSWDHWKNVNCARPQQWEKLMYYPTASAATGTTRPGSPKSHPSAPQKVLGFWGCFWLSVFGIKLPLMPLQKDSSFRSIHMYLKTPSNKFVLKPQVLGVHGSSFCLEMIAAHHSSFLQHCTESLMLFIAFTLEQLQCKKRKTFKTTRPFQEKCQPPPPYWITKVGRLVKQKPTVATESKEPSVRQDVAGTERKSHKNIFIPAVTA